MERKHFNANDIYVGAVIRIERQGDFEGYARLIIPEGELWTHIDEDDGPVIINQRWLVEWLTLNDLQQHTLEASERMTQSVQAGKMCHRTLQISGGMSWEAYIAKWGMEDESDSDQISGLKDSFGGIF